MGDNGIIKKAEYASDLQRAATVKDTVSMWQLDKELAKSAGVGSAQTREELLADLLEDKLITESEKATVEETGSVTIAGQVINFGTDAKTLVDMFNAGELKIGDYVNYQNPTSGTKTISAADSGMATAGTSVGDQTYDVSKNQLTWRVLGIDEETGGLKLIAGSPMKTNRFDTVQDPYLYLYSAAPTVTVNGEMKAVTILNDICSMYKNEYAIEARSVNMSDVDSITGVTTVDKIKEVNFFPQIGAKQYGETYSFANHYTPESWLNNKTTTTVSGTVDAYAYVINPPAEAGITGVTLSDTTAYNLLFNNVEWTGGEGQGACYWLASSGVYAYSVDAYFGPGVVYSEDGLTVAYSGYYLFGSDGSEGRGCCAVRPVVVLDSGVTAEQISKTNQTETEATWNYTANPDAEEIPQ